jgi:hypothetical protein
MYEIAFACAAVDRVSDAGSGRLLGKMLTGH